MTFGISGPFKRVEQSHHLRTVRQVGLNEQHSDEKRHLAEMEEQIRDASQRKHEHQGDEVAEPPVKSETPSDVPPDDEPDEASKGHIDFKA